MSMEKWKDIPKYEGLYQVSDLGRVKRLQRYILTTNGVLRNNKEKLLPGCYDKDGYVRYSLSKNGVCKSLKGHFLVCAAFLNYSHRPLYCIDHINNIKEDNKLTNLQVITIRENCNKDRKNTKSKYPGVIYKNGKWASRIGVVKERLWLGTFDTELEASLAYQTKLKEITNEYRK